MLLFAAYLAQARHGASVNSDGASNALQAWDMLHGNLLLRGWAVADVSFYTTDMPQYMLAESVRGLGAEVVPVAAAASYVVLVLLAGLVARGRRAGRAGVIRFLIAAGIMLAPQLGNATKTLLSSPDHVATGIPLLLAWSLIDRWTGQERCGVRDQRSRAWLIPLLVAALLTWAGIGDPLTGLVGALPLAAVCGWRAGRLAVNGERLTAAAADLSLAGAAVLSVPAAAVTTRLISAAGGWSSTPVRTTFATPDQLPRHLVLAAEGLLQLFGADFLGQHGVMLAGFAILHLAGAGLAGWAAWLAVRRLGGSDLLVQVLAAGIAANLAGYLLLGYAADISDTREIAPVLPYAAVLAGRLLARRVGGSRLAPAMTAVLAAYCLMLVADAAQPPVLDPTPKLTAWLTAHGLTTGLAGYWQSNVVTLDSHGAIEVRAVTVNSGRLRDQSYWDARNTWYDPGTRRADFVVSQGTARHWRGQVLIRTMEATAGRPSQIYQVGPYTVAVWSGNLLSRLH